jgi:hypothetical protein
MAMRHNRREISELFQDELQAVNRRYGEHLSELEAQHERRVREKRGRDEIEQGLSILPETTKTNE